MPGSRAAQYRRHGMDLESLDRASLDQKPIETPGFGASGAAVEQTIAALQDLFLFRKARTERELYLYHLYWWRRE